MNVFLEELSQEYSEDYILLVADNASWHRSKGLVIPKNIEIYPLLPYTPELNPIEQIWDDVREKGFKNVTIHKQKLIAIPDEVLGKYLLKQEIEGFKNGETGIFSITVSGYKQS